MSGQAPPRIAVVGVSTLIGAAVLDEIRARKVGHAELHALDEARSVGRPLDDDGEARSKALLVMDVAEFDFSRVDLVFFCGRSAIAARYAEAAAAHAFVIDSGTTFRGRTDVPLLVADVNGAELAALAARGNGLVALPGSASVALATVLAPLHLASGLERAEVTTLHAVSGSGRAAMDELAGETVAMLSGKKARGRAFGRQIAFNVIPQVDSLEVDGATKEEHRLRQETQRVLGLPQLAVNTTAVRVPVFFGHSLSLHAQFARTLTAATATVALQAAPGLQVIDANSSDDLPTPATLATMPDRVYVGRIRDDATRGNAVNLWVVADNVRKCAAHNAVSVCQILVNSSR